MYVRPIYVHVPYVHTPVMAYDSTCAKMLITTAAAVYMYVGQSLQKLALLAILAHSGLSGSLKLVVNKNS